MDVRVFPLLSRWLALLTFLASAEIIASEYYQYTTDDTMDRNNVNVVKEDPGARHLFCKASAEPNQNMTFLNKLPNLETIDANTCGIRGIDYNLYNQGNSFFLRHLHALNLSSNNINYIKDHCFKSLQYSLQTLTLSNNEINRIAPEAFYNLRQLEVLDLSNNRIENINEISFKDLGQLKTVSLANNKLQMLNFHLFSDSIELETLNFHANLIMMLNMTTTIWNNMSFLDLSNNLIYNLDNIQAINQQFPNLQVLNLSTRLTQCDSTIKTAYPHLHVDYLCEVGNDLTQFTGQSKGIFPILFGFSFVYSVVLMVLAGIMCCRSNVVVIKEEQQKPQPDTPIDVNPIYESVM